MIDLKSHIRTIPDYPKPGILFYDIGTLLAHGAAWQETIARMSDILRPLHADMIVGVESRGFLCGAAVAETVSRTYQLEYGSDVIEMQKGVLKEGDRVILCDDLLATGGTAAAAIELIRQQAAEVLHAAFVIELDFLNGRTRLNVPVTSLLHYEN